MGTRALTTIKDNKNKTLVVLYRQSDGYQDCHGKELKKFLSGIKLVNGIQDYSAGIANGMGCLAAQLIAKLKGEVGQHYIYAEGAADDWVDFKYTIYPTNQTDESTISIKVELFDEILFDGLVSEYVAKDVYED